MDMNPPIFVSVSTEPQNPQAARESVRYDYFVRRLLKADTEAMEALHIGLGISGEVGELFYADSDEDFKEELGDLWFYTQAGLNHYGLTEAECIASWNENASYIGFVGAAGKIADCIKREYIYNKPRDIAAVKEAFGDLFFAMQFEYSNQGVKVEDVLQANALKLETRYAGLVYSDLAAQQRADKAPGT